MCWIKIHRKLLEWEWYSDTNTTRLWIHLLLSVNYEDKKWRGQVIKRGQMVASRSSLSEETGLSERLIRTSLQRLVSTNEIKVETTNRFTIITICKYDEYQVTNNEDDQQTTNKRPANDQQTTTTKELKNIEKENIDKSISKKESLEDDISRSVCAKSSLREYAPRVHLKEKEYSTLVAKYGEADTLWMIQKLSAYKISKNKSYASDYGAINSWVVDRMQEEKQKARPKETSYTNDKYW